MTSTIKVNNIQNQCGANIINENSNTITLGASGDTIALASGASQTGFGRNGAVNWQTSIKTVGFTAVSGEGYFCDTTSGGFTVTLPSSPSVGDIVAVSDYANTFDTGNCTLGRNSSNIEGDASDYVINVEGVALTLVYADATKGWIVVNSGNSTDGKLLPAFIVATGGCVSTVCTNFKVHTFNSPGTFTVTCAGNSAGSNTVSYVVVAGGGGGGDGRGGGGGGGGYREGLGLNDSYTGSPLRAPTGVPVTAQAYPITIGAGGAGATSNDDDGNAGNPSVFSTITAAAGGKGGGVNASIPIKVGGPGGSGGGSGGTFNSGDGTNSGGTGNTPPVSPPQGNNGGDGVSNGPPNVPGSSSHGATGGGAGGAGSPATGTPAPGSGGVGVSTSIAGSPVAYAGGAGGASDTGATGGSPCGTGGDGLNSSTPAKNGATNTGGGGGGVQVGQDGGSGGSGRVIIRYKFQ